MNSELVQVCRMRDAAGGRRHSENWVHLQLLPSQPCSKGHVPAFWFFHCTLGHWAPASELNTEPGFADNRHEEERAKPCPQGTYSLIKQKWVKSHSRVQLFAIPWTVAYQAPPSMGFSRKSNGVGCHFLLQGIFLTQGSNPGLPHCRQTLYHLSHQESPLLSKALHDYLVSITKKQLPRGIG